nr:SDR family oxidoreductase [Streptomyces sp. gb1(2016)]
MADRYLHFTGTASGRFLTRRLGLPQPAPLRRWTLETPSLDGPLLHLTAGSSAHADTLGPVLATTGLKVTDRAERPAAVVLDATGVTTAAGLADVHAALHPVVRSLAGGGRIVVLGTTPSPDDHHQAAAQQALEGFVRSLGKEIGRGATAQLLRLAPGADAASAESTLRFLLSPRSAYISGQVVELTTDAPGEVADWAAPLTGRTALVTGSARGIGAAVASVLARDGARVICLDVPQAEEELTRTADRLGAAALPLNITAPDALRPRVTELEARVGRETHRIAVELLGADESRPGVRETVQEGRHPLPCVVGGEERGRVGDEVFGVTVETLQHSSRDQLLGCFQPLR